MTSRKIILIVIAICIGGMALMGKKVLDNQVFAPTCAAKEVAIPVNPRQIAESITVKVLSGNGGGSGILIDKKGQVYTVLTNQHVLTPGEPYRIQTPDGVVYSANAITNVNFGKNDVALLQFRADADYAVAVLAALETRFLGETGFLGNLAVNEEVFAAGFPFDSQKLTFNSGKISLLPDKTLQGGYRIGYTNDIQKGMSGGPILNSQGQVIGINGVHAYPLFGDPYVFEDGSKPSDAQKEQMTRLSWGVPIQTAVQAIPELAATNLVKNVERIAQEITVLITYPNGNGSGVIIAQRDNTYYVLTANHVVRDETQYEVSTPDGRCYPVNYRTVKKFEGVDLAVLEFKSDRSYRVATLAKYDLGTKDRTVFVSGWPGSKQGVNGKLSRLFTAGILFDKEIKALAAKDSSSFTDGYNLLYTNITGGGVSGGPVLDTRGRLIGIHGRAEGDLSVDEGEQEHRILLGNSLGVPIATFLNIANQVGIELRVENYEPPPVTQTEFRLIEESLLPVEVPTSRSSAINWLNYGNQLFRLRRIEEAITAFDKAIKLNPDFYQAWYARGLILIIKDRFPEALASFDKATQIEPKFSPAWRWRGVMLYSYLKRYPEALVSFNKAIQVDPKDYMLYWMRGNAYFQLKEYQRAIADLNEAIRLKPDYAISYQIRGATYSEFTEYQQAIADYNQAIRLKPNYTNAYLGRGNAYFQLKEYQNAISDYNEAIRLDPDYANAYYKQGLAYFQLKEHQKAIADYNQAIRLKPDFPDAYLARGTAYDQLKEYQKALADYNQAIRLKPDFPDAYLARGIAYDQLKEYQKVIADYNQAIRLKPDCALAYAYRGVAKLNLGDKEGGSADYQKAAQLFRKQGDMANYQLVLVNLKNIQQ